jgi:uncharacterized protein YoxC
MPTGNQVQKKLAKLSNVFVEVTTVGRQIFGYESKTADLRKLILDSVGTIHKLINKIVQSNVQVACYTGRIMLV